MLISFPRMFNTVSTKGQFAHGCRLVGGYQERQREAGIFASKPAANIVGDCISVKPIYLYASYTVRRYYLCILCSP